MTSLRIWPKLWQIDVKPFLTARSVGQYVSAIFTLCLVKKRKEKINGNYIFSLLFLFFHFYSSFQSRPKPLLDYFEGRQAQQGHGDKLGDGFEKVAKFQRSV